MVLLRSYHVESDTQVSNGPRAAKQSDRKHKDRAHQPENTVDGDAHQAERQSQQPNDWVPHESQQTERPPQDQQDDPSEESSHGNLLCNHRKSFRATPDPGPPPPSPLLHDAARRAS